MVFDVLLTQDAVHDIEELYDYISRYDSSGKAHYVLDHFEKVFHRLSENPARGAFPKELLSLGIRDFRELFFKPYRIIYTITEAKVFVVLIADGRRDMQSLLQRRLLLDR